MVGIDLNEDSIRYGNFRFGGSNIFRSVGDAQEFIQEDGFDYIVSFETIEHLPKYEQFLMNMVKTLKKDGYFFVSTPIVKVSNSNCKNPYHVIEWSFDDFHKLIENISIIESIYLQNIEFTKKKTFFGKLFQNKKNKFQKIEFEKYTNQCEIDKIKIGYQMLICRKK